MTRKSDFIALVILASVSVLPWFRLGLTGNGVWTFWDNIFNFYPLSAFWDSLSAINSVYSNFGVQNMGVLGGFPVYGFQYLGSMLGLSVVAQSRLTYMLPWMLRGTGMFILLSAIDRHDSKYSLFAKLGASVLYQFAPSGDPFSNNLVSVVTGVAPIALAIFVKGINSSKRYRYAILFSVWFGLAAISAYALVFISVLVILYALLASLRTGKIRHNVTFLVLCLALSLLSISYVFIPYAYSQVYHASSILGGNQLGLTTSGLQDKFQGILQFSTKNGPEYGLLGLENGIWQWFPLYTQVIVILSLALTAILAYFFLLLKRDSNMLFFAIVGISGVALATTVTLPLFGSVYLFGFQYFYPLFVDPTYFLYFIWFGVCGLVGLGGSKLLSLMSQQRRGVMPIMAVLLIGIIAVDSYPMAVAAPAPYSVSPIQGFPIPSQYYQLYGLLSNATVGSRLLEVPLPNYDFSCYGVTSPGFTWAGSPGCFNTWLSKLVPRQVESIEDMGLLQPIGYQAVYTNLQKGNLNSLSEQRLIENLNLKYIFVHKDLVGEPGWVGQLIARLGSIPNYTLINSNEYFNLYRVDYPSLPLYVVNSDWLQPSNGTLSYQVCTPLECGLVGYWSLSEGKGTIIYDSVTGNSGTLVNSPTWLNASDCKLAHCLGFSGNEGQYITALSTDLPTGSEPRSVFAWIYQNSTSNAKDILSYGSSSTGQSFSLSEGPNGDLHFSGWNCDASTGIPLSADTWHFVGVVYGGGSNVTMYQDGRAYPERLSHTLDSGSNGNLYIGKGNFGKDFTGRINSVLVYKYALNLGQMNVLYNSSLTNLANAMSTPHAGSDTMLETSKLSEWNARISITSPSVVILTQVFDNQWQAYLDGQPLPQGAHILVNGYANGWYVNATGAHTLSIRNEAQPYFYLGAWISAVYWLVAVTLVAITFGLKRKIVQLLNRMETRNLT